MNSAINIMRSINRRLIATLLGSLLLFSCGGSIETAGIGGTGITSGEVTGFGSIFVNGVEFNTDNSQFDVDDNTAATQSDLAIGMVVIIDGSTDASGLTGTANSVVYDDQIQGPVEVVPAVVTGSGGSQKSFTLFGQQVTIDQASTSFIGTSFDTLAMNDLVEVSGFFAPDSSIHATFVRKYGALPVPGATQVELEGTITAFTTTTVTLGGVFNSIAINIYPTTTIINIPGGLAIGLFVEVKGIYQGPASIDATKIEAEDDDFGDSVDQISLQGIVAQFNGIDDFTIDNQPIDATGATISPAGAMIEEGANVEVEGSIVGGILIADEVELRQGSVEFKAVIDFVDTGTGEIRLSYFSGTITVSTDSQTRFEDDGGPDITLNDLNIGEFLVVKGIDNNGSVTATNVRRRALDETEIQGSVESNVSGISITILGITHTVDGSTIYEISSAATDEFTFFTGLSNGDIVQIRDNQPPDGIADEVSK